MNLRDFLINKDKSILNESSLKEYISLALGNGDLQQIVVMIGYMKGLKDLNLFGAYTYLATNFHFERSALLFPEEIKCRLCELGYNKNFYLGYSRALYDCSHINIKEYAYIIPYKILD